MLVHFDITSLDRPAMYIRPKYGYILWECVSVIRKLYRSVMSPQRRSHVIIVAMAAPT
jgi:hypothetical protein